MDANFRIRVSMVVIFYIFTKDYYTIIIYYYMGRNFVIIKKVKRVEFILLFKIIDTISRLRLKQKLVWETVFLSRPGDQQQVRILPTDSTS